MATGPINGLGKQLDALEQIAEDVRRRNLRHELREVMSRRARLHGWGAPTDNEVTRVLERALQVERWLAEGLSFEEAARLIAREQCLDPDRVMELYHQIKAAER